MPGYFLRSRKHEDKNDIDWTLIFKGYDLIGERVCDYLNLKQISRLSKTCKDAANFCSYYKSYADRVWVIDFTILDKPCEKADVYAFENFHKNLCDFLEKPRKLILKVCYFADLNFLAFKIRFWTRFLNVYYPKLIDSLSKCTIVGLINIDMLCMFYRIPVWFNPPKDYYPFEKHMFDTQAHNVKHMELSWDFFNEECNLAFPNLERILIHQCHWMHPSHRGKLRKLARSCPKLISIKIYSSKRNEDFSFIIPNFSYDSKCSDHHSEYHFTRIDKRPFYHVRMSCIDIASLWKDENSDED